MSGPDQAPRRHAASEQHRSVLIEGPAGAGKTSLLVERVVALVAPEGGGPAVDIDAIALIAFTRSAAAELRRRLRERLLVELGRPEGAAEGRAARLCTVLAGLTAAPVGTLEDLAHRLLRGRAMEAGLGPADVLVEDPVALAYETFCLLVDSAQAGTLAAELGLGGAAARPRGAAALPEPRAAAEVPLALVAEAEQTVQDALRLGLRAEGGEHGYAARLGLDDLVEAFVLGRDARPRVGRPPFDRERFRRAVDELTDLSASLQGASPGAAWIRGCACLAASVRDEQDPLVILRVLGPALGSLRERTRRRSFHGDAAAWDAWKLLSEGRGRPGGIPLLRDLLDPAEEQLATRLARLEPVVLALHERVKRRRGAVDPLDLLLKLRDVLAGDMAARAALQGLFRHIAVDDLQDVRPLQAEILLYLAEDGARARSAREVRLAPGRLTLAADPRQAMDPALRADPTPFEDLRARVRDTGALEVTLTASLRSPAVHVMPIEPAGDPRRLRVAAWRALEAEALAAYLRWLVEASGIKVRGEDGRFRPVRHGDVAVIAVEGAHLGFLRDALDRAGVPHAARGGRLELEDPILRRFVLGLRALADPDDGVAIAALLRPPFFALTLEDHWRYRALGSPGLSPADLPDPGARRVARALDLLSDLRRRRLERPPGVTARDLLEQTALAHPEALGPSAPERLARLREICFALGELAAREGLDYDTATARLLAWADRAPELSLGPVPDGASAAQILTAREARGRDFPVVALWDGRASALHAGAPRLRPRAFWVDPRSGAWGLCLHAEGGWQIGWSRELLEQERARLASERRRLAHVAVTRARDLLVLPRPALLEEPSLLGALLRDARLHAAIELAPYREGAGAPWPAARRRPPPKAPAAPPRPDPAALAAWQDAARDAARPRFERRDLTPAAHEQELAPVSAGDPPDPPTPAGAPPSRVRAARFDPAFAATVHRALVLLVRGAPTPEAAVQAASVETGLRKRLSEAARDVARARSALRTEGLWKGPGVIMHADYPIAGLAPGGTLLGGSVDLLAVTLDELFLLQIRADVPPQRMAEIQEDIEPLRRCADLLGASPLHNGRRIRHGLLFTAEGRLWWA